MVSAVEVRDGLIHSVVCFVERLDTESVVCCRVVHLERKLGRDRDKTCSLAILDFPSFWRCDIGLYGIAWRKVLVPLRDSRTLVSGVVGVGGCGLSKNKK